MSDISQNQQQQQHSEPNIQHQQQQQHQQQYLQQPQQQPQQQQHLQGAQDNFQVPPSMVRSIVITVLQSQVILPLPNQPLYYLPRE